MRSRDYEARLVATEEGPALYSPAPGRYRDAPVEGALVRAGDVIGALEVLGQLHPIKAPAGAFGVVAERIAPDEARPAVDYRSRLFVLRQEELGAMAGAVQADDAEAHGGPVFRTPLGGRYYARPAPDAEPFVTVGAVIEAGAPVAIIEVMKTFNRVLYDGEPATVTATLVADGEDVVEGAPLLALEPR